MEQNTALGATAEKEGNIIFISGAHEKFYYEKLKEVRYQDGKGMDADNSEAIQTVRKAQELLDKLSAYKPLAKVEELEEGNYNMVDNVLNNGAEKKEQERASGRISIKEKLAEKKAAIEHKDKAIQKDQDKKTQREM